jgi:DNA-binding NtrC family response regulator
VITDFIMPHMDGFQLMDLINDKWPQLPVVLLTGYLFADGGEVIRKGKAAAVITKPVRLNDVVITVKRILEPVHSESQKS